MTPDGRACGGPDAFGHIFPVCLDALPSTVERESVSRSVCARLQGLRESPNSEGLQLTPTKVTLRGICVAAAIAMCQITGSGLHATQDDLASVRQAAEAGDADAQNTLGDAHATGEGVLKDASEAVRWYGLAAEQGHVRAQYNLGNMYVDGILKSHELAHMWFNIAGANGHERAAQARDVIERKMTSAELWRATKWARECMTSRFQHCSGQPVPAGTILSVGDAGVTAPALVHQVRPQYPPRARQRRHQGTVSVELVVDADGSVEVVKVVDGQGPELDQAAIEALQQWRFRPGSRFGVPVPVRMEISVSFSLSG